MITIDKPEQEITDEQRKEWMKNVREKRERQERENAEKEEEQLLQKLREQQEEDYQKIIEENRKKGHGKSTSFKPVKTNIDLFIYDDVLKQDLSFPAKLLLSQMLYFQRKNKWTVINRSREYYIKNLGFSISVYIRSLKELIEKKCIEEVQSNNRARAFKIIFLKSNEKSHYTIINNAILILPISSQEKIIMSKIQALQKKTGYCEMKIKQIAKVCFLDTESTGYYLRKLIKNGYLLKEKQGYKVSKNL